MAQLWPVDRRLHAPAFWLALALTGLVCAIYYLSVPPSPDQSIFDEIGLMSILGHPFYGGAFDISWPGPLVYHELGIRLFGIHGWTARATDLCLLPIGLAGLWLLASRAGYRAAGAALVLLYPIIYVTSGLWMAGHRDMVGMHMLLLAAGLLIGGGRQPHLRRMMAGALIAYATMVRPTYLFALLPFWLIEMHRERAPRARLIATVGLAAGMIAILLLFLIGGWRQGTIGDWYEQAILFPVTVYQVPESRWRLPILFLTSVRASWAWLAITALTGLLLSTEALTRTARARPSPAPYIWSLFATVGTSYFVQNKGFVYHLGGLIPLFLFCALVGIEAGWRAARRASGWRRPTLYALAGITLLGVAAGTLARIRHNLVAPLRLVAGADRAGIARYVARRDDPDAAARVAAGTIIRAASAPGDQVLQWGWNYEAGFLSGRPSATRFVNTIVLPAISPDDRHFARWIDRFASEMTPSRVRFIILDTSLPPLAPSPSAPVAGARAIPILRALVRSGYGVRYRGGTILLLERARAG